MVPHTCSQIQRAETEKNTQRKLVKGNTLNEARLRRPAMLLGKTLLLHLQAKGTTPLYTAWDIVSCDEGILRVVNSLAADHVAALSVCAYLCISPKPGNVIPAAPKAVAPLNDPGSMIEAAIVQPGRFQIGSVPLHCF